jgi:hypothetical protein
MPAPTLFETAFDNRGLFSDHYLEERFPARDDVQALQEDADAAFEQVRARYRRVIGEADTWNEAQTEDHFVQPLLKDVLGWACTVQPRVQKQGRAGRPDYALFTSEARRAEAVDRADGDETELFAYADAVADAKYWGRPLDGPAPDPARDRNADLRRSNPSFQIIDYVTLTGVDWGLLTNGARWRLYYEGAPSRLETYFEVNLPEICRLSDGDADEQAEARRAFRLFYALFRAEAHQPTVEGEKFIDVIYAASDTYAEDLEDTLKERVFDHVFLELATGLYKNHVRNNGAGDPEQVLDDVYRATLRLLYRLLFLLYAESRGLLPLDNPGYCDHSLTHLTERARELVADGRPLSEKHADVWNDLDALFETIDEGDPAFDVPAYNGGLFRRDGDDSAVLDTHEIGQKYVARALVNLTAVDPGGNPTGPSVDYTSLDVRQLGSIYEGLLEHRLVIADDDSLDLRTDEGERKETGSYYTPHYVVEYIVEETLGPIVDERIEQFEDAMAEIADTVDGRDPDDPGVRAKLDAPRQRALDAFLTVRVCDPAMGSGHFLVYAADYLAERFGQILGRYPDHNPVTQRLDEIRQSILDELERQGVDTNDLENDHRLRDTSLLKRLVMKRCIYGVDKNPMAVELAKLSLWLHSFTVGAPLSFLDHHLKAGNSLIGTAVDTVVEEIRADLFGNVRDEILRGTKFLQDAAFNADATLTDVEASASAFRAYQDKMTPYKRLLDLWTAQHFGHEMGRTLVRDYAREVIDAYKAGEGAVLDEHADTVEAAEALSDDKSVFHWELEFPEVFYELDPPGDRDNPGFDAVIGNPPYVNIKDQSKQEGEYYRNNIPGVFGRADLAVAFASRMLDRVKWEGRLSYIMTNKFLKAHYGRPFMERMEEETRVETLIDLTDSPVFEDPRTYPAIVHLVREQDPNEEEGGFEIAREIRVETSAEVKEYLYSSGEESLQRVDILSLPVTTNPLRDLCDWIREGSANGKDEVFVLEEGKTGKIEDAVLKPFIYPSDIRRYTNSPQLDHVALWPYGEDGRIVELEDYPGLESYVNTHANELRSRYCVREGGKELHAYHDPAQATVREGKKIAVGDIGLEPEFGLVDEEVVFKNTLYVIIPKQTVAPHYLLAILNSRLTFHAMKSISPTVRGGYLRYKTKYLERLPIREIEFTTDEDEREAHVDTLVDRYETARDEHTDPADADVLDAVEDPLDADRTGVVHDLLAHLAREMTDLKEERATYHLDVTDYVPAPSADEGVGLRALGRYQPAPGAPDSLLADTTDERDGLRVGRLTADRASDGETVHVRATARFKPSGDPESWPDAVPAGAEPDQWGYVETDPLPVCTLRDCSELEAGLVVHWLDALNEADAGFSGYRDNATKTNSLLDRLYDLRVPDPSESDVQNALRPFLDNAQAAAALDLQIQFTDDLIDQIVYRLYGLSDEEVAVVEGNT